MSETMLICQNVSIKYCTGDFKYIGFKEWLTRRLSGNYEVNDFWANRNVTFSLKRGDMLGIVGTNGAGKSTLLKAISGIMEPNEGLVKRKGQIAALLELSSGFDGDLTVKENAYLRGAMLGYTRKFMDETYPAILKFSELEEFENRPFKQLSSGMKSRLAFSIASLVKPEILILDEVLSVGDGAFRRKSEAKMREILANGTTTILVSHSTPQVRTLCNKVLWLDHGRQVVFSDDVKGICACYEQFLAKGTSLALMLDGQWSAQCGVLSAECGRACRPAAAALFTPHSAKFPYGFAVSGLTMLTFEVAAQAATGGNALPRAGLIRLRFLNANGKEMRAPELWTSSAYGGHFVYVHLNAEGRCNFKVRIALPAGATTMEVQFCNFNCKTDIQLMLFAIKCGDDATAEGPRVRDPSELIKSKE